jgi:hypothetical protein
MGDHESVAGIELLTGQDSNYPHLPPLEQPVDLSNKPADAGSILWR